KPSAATRTGFSLTAGVWDRHRGIAPPGLDPSYGEPHLRVWGRRGHRSGTLKVWGQVRVPHQRQSPRLCTEDFPMEIIARFTQDQLDHTQDNNVHFVVSLKAPTLDWMQKRPQLCVLPVIDLSGSMGGDKLR